MELAPEYRYSVRITPTLPLHLTAELPLPLVGSLVLQTKSSGLPVALQQRPTYRNHLALCVAGEPR